MSTREHIIDRLHKRVGVCMYCKRQGCGHGSNTELPYEVAMEDVLWAINLDGYFDKSDPAQGG